MMMNKPIVAMALLCALVAPSGAADLVVVGHPSTGAQTKDQIADIFLGKNLSLTPVDQPEAAPIRADFYKQVTGRDPAQVKAVWSRLVFSGKAQPPKELPDSAAVKKAVAADPKVVGYIEKAAVDASVKVITPLD